MTNVQVRSTLMQRILITFDNYAYFCFITGPPKAVFLVPEETCDGANVSWTVHAEDDVDEYIVHVQCDGGFNSSVSLQPNSSFIFLNTSDFVNDSACNVSVLAHNLAGWSPKKTTLATVREGIYMYIAK